MLINQTPTPLKDFPHTHVHSAYLTKNSWRQNQAGGLISSLLSVHPQNPIYTGEGEKLDIWSLSWIQFAFEIHLRLACTRADTHISLSPLVRHSVKPAACPHLPLSPLCYPLYTQCNSSHMLLAATSNFITSFVFFICWLFILALTTSFTNTRTVLYVLNFVLGTFQLSVWSLFSTIWYIFKHRIQVSAFVFAIFA